MSARAKEMKRRARQARIAHAARIADCSAKRPKIETWQERNERLATERRQRDAYRLRNNLAILAMASAPPARLMDLGALDAMDRMFSREDHPTIVFDVGKSTP